MAARRRRPSSVTTLPEPLRKELDRLLTEGKFTLSMITDHLRSMGAEVSRSAVHRYSQTHEEIAADIRRTREMAAAIGRELQDVNGDDGRLLIESLHGLILRVRMQIAEQDEISPEDLSRLTRSAKDLQQALKANVETASKVRERALKEAASAAEEVGKAEGLTGSTVEAIKARILGVQKQ